MKVDPSSRERTILTASDGVPGSPAPDAIKRQRARKPNPYRQAERPGVPLLLTVPEAAEMLRTTPDALRVRLRRAQVAGGDGSITAPLGPGIVGLKIGANTWRLRVDKAT
jgi:hypothetical protein